MSAGDKRRLTVHQATVEAEDVMSLRLVHPDGGTLEPWTPGAHIDVLLPSGLIRQYSLCGDPRDRVSYTIAVLNDPRSEGGSREVHSLPLVGKGLDIRGPRNHFALVDASTYLFVAGGIGITPIRTMVREARQRGDVEWKLLYGGRSRHSMAFVEELEALGDHNVEIVPQDERGLPDIERFLDYANADAAVYCCGPEGLIRAVTNAHSKRWGGAGAVHVERFSSPRSVGPPEARSSETEFEVELRRSNILLQVPEDRTLLAVIRDALPDTPFRCEEGYCGTCETGVIEGIPDHRDDILTDSERESNETMMICVGRSLSPRLVLDL